MDFGDHNKFLEARAAKGDLVLVLGAGVNADSLNRRNEPIKAGRGLSELLCEEMGETHAGEPLSDVVSAFEHVLGRDALNKVLVREFRFTKPSDHLTRLFQYTWRRIYTWNYDDAIIDASKSSVQRTYLYNGMADSVEDLPELSELQLVFLHGLITQLDKGIILSSQDYADVLQRGDHDWYKRAVQDYRASTVVFIGTGLNEPILQAELERASKSGLGGAGLAFLVVPEAVSPVRAASLAQRGIIHVQGTLSDLVDWLGDVLGATRPPAAIVSTGRFFNESNLGRFTLDDIAAAQNLKPINRDILLNGFENETPARQQAMARSFLNGFPPTWSLAASGIPVRLAQLPELHERLSAAVSDAADLFITVGQAGSGKSTATMQALLDISTMGDIDVFELSSETKSVSKAINVLARVSNKRKVVYIPNLFVFGGSLADDFPAAREAKVTFVSTARSSEWKEYFERYYSGASTYVFQKFSREDHQPLIDRLKSYVPSPAFVKLKPDQQIDKLARSKNQLLIALREATESRNFEDIIIDEFRSLADDDVRELFVIIGLATLARVGIQPAFAAEAYNLIRRNRSFNEALARLEGIVAPVSSGRLLARHEFYVRNILDKVVPIDTIIRLVCSTLSTFTKYSIPITKHVGRPDAALFRFLLNNGFLRERSERGGDKYAGLDVYRNFEISFQLDGHFWLQYGLYYQRLGNVPMAIEMLEKSLQAFPDNPFAIHALASERLIQAGRRPSFDPETRRQIRLAVAELERLHSNPMLSLDQYPLVTLSRHHVPVLLAHKQGEAAIEVAKDYYDRLRQMEKKMSSPEISAAKAQLLKFVTTRTWES